MTFFPEGKLINKEKNKSYTSSLLRLKEAKEKGIILEGICTLCDKNHNLRIRLNSSTEGIIPREEGAMGIKEGKTRDIAILSRVNKPCSFMIEDFIVIDGKETAILSRRKAQQSCFDNYIKNLKKGDVIPCRVTHLEPFGAFCDIGCGISSLIPIDLISVSRISHPRERFKVGDDILAVIKDIAEERVYLTHKELLGTWEENARLFSYGETCQGLIRSVESYGVFVELTPNLAGLAEPFPEAKEGMSASVFIKSIIPDKMKVKLIIIEAFDELREKESINYIFKGNHMDTWKYSPKESLKIIETVF